MDSGEQKENVSVQINLEKLMCFLTGDKSLTQEEAEQVLSGVAEELKKLNFKELPERTLLELVDSKLKEYELSGRVRKVEPAVRESAGLDISENALRVLKKRYLAKDEEGKTVETPEQMFHRVARTLAEVDGIYDPTADISKVAEEFYRMMTRFEFMPNSPTLMNAGRILGQLSACFVIPVDDSLDSIFEAVKYTALIHKSGGGTGFSFSRLRPRNDVVHSTKGVASGPISFMKVFDAATEEIKQGGTRRGANMGILRVDHPDIKDFIRAKDDQQVLRNFNLSVSLTEDFMKAVIDDRTFQTKSPRSKAVVDTIRAREIFDTIVEQAWKNGEPGIIFIDRINRDNPTPTIGDIESTNPCGEQPLLAYESCNLGSINLAKMFKDGPADGVDWDKLRKVTHSAVHFLDNVIDANKYPIPQIERMTKSNRKIGLGIMGFADLLIQLGIPYDTEDALNLGEKLMAFIQDEGRKASMKLAEQRGPFPNYDVSTYKQRGMAPLRNATITTVAPTGTISIISGCSSGIEPIFALAYIRNVMDQDELAEANAQFERVAKERGFYSKDLMIKIAKHGHLTDIPEVPDDVKKVFRTAHEIVPEWHIRMQAAFQKYTDNAVSKTVNFGGDASKDDIAKVYQLAYQLGCKGVTVYRYGSRSEQVLNIGEVNRPGAEQQMEDAAKEHRLEPRPRPEVIWGLTRKMPTGCGTLYVTVNMDEQRHLFEVFTNMGKAGGCSASQAEAISRLISLALRAGIKSEEIVKQIKGIRCPMMTWWKGDKILSCADAIAKAIELFPSYTSDGSKPLPTAEPSEATAPPAWQEETAAQNDEFAPKIIHDSSPGMSISNCPECGGTIEYKEGCLTCPLCGYTKCL